MASHATLPDLQGEYPLTADQIAAYQRDGHILLRGVVPPEEIAVYRAAIVEAVRQLNKNTRPLEERDTYGKAFIQIGNLWQHDETVRQFVLARRFARIAAELTGAAGIRLYHDQALFKEALGGPTPWHQDQHYWPVATDQTITMWMPLVDVSEEMGTMNFASGSHTGGYLGPHDISDDSQVHFGRFVREKGYPLVNYGAMRAGDASFHAGWTLHCAPGNRTRSVREAMTIIFFADGARVGPIDNNARRSDLNAFLPGLQPGDLADGPLVPVLYRQG